MLLLPLEKFCIDTLLTPTEVQEKMDSVVGRKEGFSFTTVFSKSSYKYFSGSVVKGQFEIKRVINYRNSFFPVINGNVEAIPDGSIVDIKMGLHPFVAVFMCLWFGGVAIAVISLIIGSIASGEFLPALLIPCGMLPFGYLLMIGAFTIERNRAKEKLLEVLEGHIAH